MFKPHPIIDFVGLIALHIYHYLKDGHWTPLFTWPSRQQRQAARQRLERQMHHDRLWAEAKATPARWLCVEGHPMTEEEAEEALIRDRERWRQYLDIGHL